MWLPLKTFSAKPFSLISLIFDTLLAQQGPESAQAGSHPQGRALTEQKAVADVCTSPEVPGLFGWAGCVHGQLLGPCLGAAPSPASPGAGFGHTQWLRQEPGSGLGAGH